MHRCNDALHQAINDNVPDVVHVCLPCRRALADFQSAVAARQELGDLLASIRDEAVALGGHVSEGVGQLLIGVHLQQNAGLMCCSQAQDAVYNKTIC